MPRSLLIGTCLLLVPIWLLSQNEPYLDSSLPIPERVADLMSRMTLQDKLQQTWCIHLYEEDNMWSPNTGLDLGDDWGEDVLKHGIGQLGKPSWAFDKGPRESAEIANAIQKDVIKSNRHGIPAIFHEEGLHGIWARGSTVFPQAIGMSCAWDPALTEEVYATVAKQIRTRGSHQANTPMLDVCRDPRWGRIEESQGEDPWLTSQMAVAMNRGLQGTGPVIDKDHIVATVKHFAGYGLSESGYNKGVMHYGERTLREVVLPPFRAAIKDAGALCLMPAYHSVDGIPMHANDWLLKDVVKQEWDFQGYIVADYNGVRELKWAHHIADNLEDAGRIGMLSGIDMELDNPYCFSLLAERMDEDEELRAALDESVRRILSVKFKLGLFEDPYVDPAEAESFNRRPENLALSQKMAEESIVLLKNEDSILPLDRDSYKRIAVIGAHADAMHYGGYAHHDTRNGVTFYQGLKDYLGDDVEVVTAEGCRIHEGDGYWLTGDYEEFDFTKPSVNQRLIRKAVKLANTCDMIILAVGGTAVSCGEFLGDRQDLNLFGQQDELVDAILALGKPVIACIVAGRPLTINTLNDKADAVLYTWYLGERAGPALARTLFGENNPSGKLTLTFPRSVGQIPYYYAKRPVVDRYFLMEDEPLYAFGYGLGYSQFEYSELSIGKPTITADEVLQISFKLKNTGKYSGEEVVQLYIRDEICSVTRPVKELKGFSKVALEPGAATTVTLDLRVDDLGFWNRDMAYVHEPGTFEIMIGASSNDIRLRTIFRLE